MENRQASERWMERNFPPRERKGAQMQFSKWISANIFSVWLSRGIIFQTSSAPKMQFFLVYPIVQLSS